MTLAGPVMLQLRSDRTSSTLSLAHIPAGSPPRIVM
jgi:hypothetical protein